MNQYIFKGAYFAEPGMTCEHCGRVISIFAVLEDGQGKVLKTGLTCAKKLESKVWHDADQYYGRRLVWPDFSRIKKDLKFQALKAKYA